jgi:uncharacterized membrane protein
MVKAKQWWGELQSSLWFVPASIVLCAVALAVGLVEADALAGDELPERWPRLFGASAEGTRGMLATIAGAQITVAGVVFSITVVALALASGQYTPRILRNFMRDRANQVVLGLFVGVFAYCLVVLRTVRGGDEGRFVPSLAVFFSFALALVGVGALIFFIHHIATAIQASSIIAAVAEETLAAVDRLFPQELGEGPEEAGEEDAGEGELERRAAALDWRAIPALKNGYIQNVDEDALLGFAAEAGAVLRMERGVGEFVVAGTPLVSLARADGRGGPAGQAEEAVNELFAIGRYRTVEQDVGFGVRQLVDIALKALSPGVNDTTTAVTCVDYLTAILARLLRRRFPSRHRFDRGELRVIARSQTFERLLAAAFDQIRRNAEGNVAVIVRLFGGLELLAREARHAGRRRALALQAEVLSEVAERSVPSPHDRELIEARRRRTLKELSGAALLNQTLRSGSTHS